jgi:HD-like signal output (HDOD) protein
MEQGDDAMRIEDLGKYLTDIPTLPMVAHEINLASVRDDFTAQSLGKIIEKDPPLTGKMLRLANSAYYGFARQVSTLDRAITLLGFNTIRNLALTVSVSQLFGGDRSSTVDLKGLWRHSLGCAVAARTLIERFDPGLAEEAFLSGIVHDIGAIILLNNFPEETTGALQMMAERQISQSEAEKKALGVTHEEVGAFLADKWNFPVQYYRVIRMHHKPPSPDMDTTEKENILQVAVYAGNQLAKAVGLGRSLDSRRSEVIPSCWQILGISLKDLSVLRVRVKEDFESIDQLFD